MYSHRYAELALAWIDCELHPRPLSPDRRLDGAGRAMRHQELLLERPQDATRAPRRSSSSSQARRAYTA
jgi:hypothetical protein